jgi:hypothetical protein
MSKRFHLWLQDRVYYDHLAMDNPARKRMIQYLNILDPQDTISILDLGSGTGASVIHFAHVLPSSFTIILVDRDIQSLQGFGDLVKIHLPDHSISSLDDSTHILTGEDREITVILKEGEILEEVPDLDGIDLISANAVFDLFTKEAFQQVVNKTSDVPVYFTLNYCGSELVSTRPDQLSSDFFVERYDGHMQRVQPFGAAMGAECCTIMLSILRQFYSDVNSGRSDWELSSGDSLTPHLLWFMEQALPDVLNEDEMTQFSTWKNEMIGSEKYLWKILHQDFFAMTSHTFIKS